MRYKNIWSRTRLRASVSYFPDARTYGYRPAAPLDYFRGMYEPVEATEKGNGTNGDEAVRGIARRIAA